MLKPDFEGFTFDGDETIFLSLDKPTRQIILHAQELEIDSAEYIHQGRNGLAAKIKLDGKSETVSFTFPKVLPTGSGELKLKFKGILNDKMRGFYRSSYTLNGQTKYLATTQFEATDARCAFPCIDEPAAKAIFDVILMIPAHMTAISNTLESNIWEHEAGYKVVEFAPTPKMSTYLLAFLVGEFEYLEGKTRDGVLVRVFTTPGKKEQGRFALGVATQVLSYYSNYFDIPYPLPVLDLIAVPDFAAGAMENWGAVTYRENALLFDEEKSSAVNKQRVAIVIAHELAHMWFGDLVTMEWWTHLWLNEGFASYIEYLAVDRLFPRWDMWTQFVSQEQGVALELDGLRNTHPIEVEVYHPNEIREIFDRVSYSKGASIIRMLAQYLGRTDFRDGLRLYLKTHQYSNASTQDLWAAWEKVSGKPVTKMMSNWTAKAGYPVLTVTESQRALKVHQSRFFLSPLAKKQVRDQTVWSVPISVLTNSSSRSNQYLMQQRSITLPKPRLGAWIKLNAGDSSFLRVDYPVKYLHLLKKAVERKKLKPLDRLGLIRDAFDLSQAGQLPTHQAFELALSYLQETDYTVWVELSAHLSQLASLVAHESYIRDFDQYAQEILRSIVARVGWQKKPQDSHTTNLLRALVLYQFGSHGDRSTIKQAQQLWQTVLAGQRIDPDLRSVVYNLVAKNGGAREHNQLIKLYKEEELHQEKDRIGRALALFKQPQLIKKTLQFALSKDVRSQDSVLIINGVSMNPRGRDLAWQFIKDHWPEFVKRYQGSFLLTRLIEYNKELTAVADAKDVERFFKKNPTPEAQRTIAQVLEHIYSHAAWLKRDGKKIAQFLHRQKAGGQSPPFV